MQKRRSPVPSEPSDPESRILGLRMSQAYLQMLDFHRGIGKTSFRAADEAARSPGPPGWLEKRLLHGDPEKVSWSDLSCASEVNPDLPQAAWSRIKEYAAEELEAGRRGAVAVGPSRGVDDPIDLARYLAIRALLREGWTPSTGIETVLVEILSQAHSAWLHWMDILVTRSVVPVRIERQSVEENGGRVAWNQAMPPEIDQAMTMADRFNRIFVRSLRALINARRYGSEITINAQTVNFAERQLNVAHGKD